MNHDHDAHAGMTLHALSRGPCQAQACSGCRKKCPCPQACGLREPDKTEPVGLSAGEALFAAIVAVAFIAFVALVVYDPWALATMTT